VYSGVVAVVTGSRAGRLAALEIRMSTGPNMDRVRAKAEETDSAEEMSVTRVRIWRDGKELSRVDLVVRREVSVRPRMAILVQPEEANALTILGPIPEPPPVMTTTFPAVESSGREGEIDG